MRDKTPEVRGIAVVDVGYSNTKVLLFSPTLELVSERKITSPHRKGKHYGEIDVEPMLAFIHQALPELDQRLPIDRIIVSAHGACIVSLKADGTLAVPIMDYMSDPPENICAAYTAQCPSFAETYSPQLPLALLHAMQLFWQSRVLPEDAQHTATILPLMQYVAHRLGGRQVLEISSMGCQSHLIDLNSFAPSQLAQRQGWAAKFPPYAKAWDVIGTYSGSRRLLGRGEIAAGVHDSNANYVRYLASATSHFTLLSTGTWIIGFNSDGDVAKLDAARDTVANVDVFGRHVACCRFFGGKEFETLSDGAPADAASLSSCAELVRRGTYALASFSDSGGPMPGTGGKGQVVGPRPETPSEKASLAALYCALMVSESLDAIDSQADIIVDGPFSQNSTFLHVLAALRPQQSVRASALKDGTAAGAACLGLMAAGLLPHFDISMRHYPATPIAGLLAYAQDWKNRSLRHA